MAKLIYFPSGKHSQIIMFVVWKCKWSGFWYLGHFLI